MNRFTPGTLASDTFFQAYLVDGLGRWNEDRTMTAEGKKGPHSYSDLLRYAANQLSEEVLGKKLVEYTAPQKYTGELIGIEYLYSQNNAVIEDYKMALTTLETQDITVAEGESGLEAVNMEDPTVPTLDTIWPPQQCTPSVPPTIRPPAVLNTSTLAAPTALCTVATMQSAAVAVSNPTPTASDPSLGPQLQPSTTSTDGALLCTNQAPQHVEPSSAEEQPSTSLPPKSTGSVRVA